MVGDTGANVIGAVLGLGVVLGSEERTRIAVMLLLLALNVAAELVSFSDVIDAVPPLRWLDRLGRAGSPSIAPPSHPAPRPSVEGDTADPLGPVPLRPQPGTEPVQPPEVLRRRDDDAADLG